MAKNKQRSLRCSECGWWIGAPHGHVCSVVELNGRVVAWGSIEAMAAATRLLCSDALQASNEVTTELPEEFADRLGAWARATRDAAVCVPVMILTPPEDPKP